MKKSTILLLAGYGGMILTIITWLLYVRWGLLPALTSGM